MLKNILRDIINYNSNSNHSIIKNGDIENTVSISNF